MRLVKRIALGLGLAGAATLYVWGAAVRAAPDVRRRKAAVRRERAEAARRAQR
jgi:hypothetical protein